ncbi:MAG: glycosyltransferase [Clostridia bacterium]|nr:glycosyltransferase [Clostridia bacterium]
MKILITTDLFTIETNGVVTSVKNLWDELKKKGHEVKILTLSENVHSHRDGEVYYIRSMPLAVYPNVRMPLSYRHRLIKELVEWRPDVIHTQCEFFTYQFARRISKKTGAPIVHTYHTLYEQYVTYVIPSRRLGEKAVKLFSKKRLKRAQRVVAPTHKVEDTLVNYGLKSEISVIPSGISLEQHKKRIAPEERQAKRRALGIPDDAKVLINLGRLGTEKNLGEIVQFYSKALQKNSKLMLLIVGDGPAREDLENQAKDLGIDDKVIFTGMVKPDEVQEYYQLGDVFVSASTSETQGLTYVEAAANGLPLLCRRDPCLDDVIREGENGYAYTNVDDFVKSIEAIVENPEWITHASKLSEEIANTFDKHTFGDAIEEMYISVIK